MQALFVLALVACHASPRPSEHVGRLYHYTRSNHDGTLPERVVVFRKSATQVEVYKSVERCKTAAYVTAEIDPPTGDARRLVAGKVARDGTQSAFGEIRRAGTTLVLSAGDVRDQVESIERPWHLYDFDLATLTVVPHTRAAAFSFGLALTWPDVNDPLRYLGRADATFLRVEQRRGVRALRFEVAGPAFGGRGGPIWFDAVGGHIIEARWGVPNHDEYTDFALVLERVEDGGDPAWRALLRAHYATCP
jgi:hypothetical protein